MSEDQIELEINGIPVTARKGAMLIEVTDAAGITVPRFCYHKKLSVAANCRMCLVEVEKAPKPLPACATPVMPGMKVFTESPKAIAAQKSTMEFLLINHPLDCPICDQGGECELQDVAMGYGEDVSRYSESKRVVRDKNIGPLIATEMTRCIHCTRCVRFGEEIAGMRELGATGRGENMEIGTYIEKSVASEMSGNVIDLCPVGALTAKPSRFAARAWEMVQHGSIGAHDSIGSNLNLHTLRGRVIRAVPRDNETINETWISDRDRFSYQGLSAQDRLREPMIKVDGKWQKCDWETALNTAAEGLKAVAPDELGALTSAHATLEELYLAQKLMRGLGSNHIDHRLRQSDFSDQDGAPLFPWLGMAIEDLEQLDALLLIGSNVRKDQPIAAHRLRKASLKGAHIMCVNPRDFDFHFHVSEQVISDPVGMLNSLAGIAKSLGADVPKALADVIKQAVCGETEQAIAQKLKAGEKAGVVLGTIAFSHPLYSTLRALAWYIAEHSGAQLGYLAEAANTAGAWLAGAVAHRGAGGEVLSAPGLHAQAMLATPRKAYLLVGVEPELDCEQPQQALAAMQQAACVVCLTAFASEAMMGYADVLLPIAAFAETSGTFVNAEGRWQSFNAAVSAPGEARPGWKVLRVLANLCALNGFDFTSSEQVRNELKTCFTADLQFDNHLALGAVLKAAKSQGLTRIGCVPMYAGDALVRRAQSLQDTVDGQDLAARMCSAEARARGLEQAQQIVVKQQDARATLSLVIDDSVPAACVWVPAGVAQSAQLGAAFGAIEIESVQGSGND